MKPTNVSVSVRGQNGLLKVFNVTFDMKGSLPSVDGVVDEKARKVFQKRLQKFIESIELPEFS